MPGAHLLSPAVVVDGRARLVARRHVPRRPRSPSFIDRVRAVAGELRLRQRQDLRRVGQLQQVRHVGSALSARQTGSS